MKILLVLRSRGREGFRGDLEEGRFGKPVNLRVRFLDLGLGGSLGVLVVSKDLNKFEASTSEVKFN